MSSVVLTPIRKKILKVIELAIKENGYPPSIREIAEKVNLSSTSSVQNHIKVLESKGYLIKSSVKPRTIRLKAFSSLPSVHHIPILGRISAGSGSLAIEDVDGELSISKDLLGSGNFFALNVNGESMRDAGLADNDLAIFRQQATAAVGDIVAALIDMEEATIKRLKQIAPEIWLHPENPDFPELYFSPDRVRIMGVLKLVLKSF